MTLHGTTRGDTWPAFASPEFIGGLEDHAKRLAEHLGREWLEHYLEAQEARVLADMRTRRENLDRLAAELGVPDCRATASGPLVRAAIDELARDEVGP